MYNVLSVSEVVNAQVYEMSDLQGLFEQIDRLSAEDFERLYRYVQRHRRSQLSWWIVPPESLERIDEIMRPVQEEAAEMPEEEVNAAIDQAIAEVRRERKAKSSD
jgi:glutamyl-tRNA reductase